MPDAGTWVALAVGLYGAGVSTVVWREQHLQRKQERARGIRVSLRTMMTANGPVFGVHAYNAEQRSVQITRAGLAGLNGPGVWHGHPYPPQLPARLGDGEAVFIELSEEWIHLVQASMGEDFVRGAVEDAGGTVYMSDPGPPLREPPPGNA